MALTGSDVYSATIPATSLTLAGLKYEVVATDGANVTTLTDVDLSIPVAETLTNDPASFFRDLGLAAERWQIVSVPALLDGGRTADQIFAGELGARGEQTWKLMQWTPSGTDPRGGRYEAAPAMTPNRAYFFRRKTKAQVDDIFDFGSAGTTPLRAQTIQLTKGWNLIATPFGFPTVWPDNLILVSFDFGSLDYKNAPNPVMQPFTGYFVKADAARTVTLNPATPLSKATLSPLHPATFSSRHDGAWAVRFIAVHDGLADVQNYAAVHPEGSDGVDAFDLEEAPNPGGLPVLSFAGSDSRTLGTDVRPLDAEGAQVWRFTVHAEEAMLGVRLVWDGLEAVPEGVALMLWDEVTSTAMSLRDAAERRIDIVAGESYALTLVAGRGEDVAQELGKLQSPITARMVLHAVSPNPFLGATRIRYELPADAPVRAEVFDLGGRRVFGVDRGVETAGMHAFTWDGRDDTGRRLGSGMYFLRVTAGANEETRKLVLMESGR
jgi:hypothetical protein